MKMEKDKSGLWQKEIQNEANDILKPTLRRIIKSYGPYLTHIRDLQDQTDIGIDYQVEIVNMESVESIITFSLQSKGYEDEDGIKPNKIGAGAGIKCSIFSLQRRQKSVVTYHAIKASIISIFESRLREKYLAKI